MMSLGKVKVFSSILLTGLLVLLIYSFFSDFGLRDDEGFYLYYLKQGISEPTFTFFHTIGNLFGYIFSYQLLGFRLLNLILILISINLSLFYDYKFYKDKLNKVEIDFFFLLVLVNIATLGFFSFIPTFSYTSSATIACFFWSAFIFNAAREGCSEDWTYYVLLLVTFLFSISSRIQLFIVLSVSLPLVLFFIKIYINKKSDISILKTTIVATTFTVFFIVLHSHFIAEIFPVGKIIYQTTHDSLLAFYLSNLIYIITHQDFYVVYFSIILTFLYLYIVFKFNLKLSINFLIIIILLLIIKDLYGFSKSYLDIAGTPSNYSNRALRYLFILTIFTPSIIGFFNLIKSKFNKKKFLINSKFIFIYLICLIAAFSSSIGNNSNFVFWASFSLGITSIPFFLSILSHRTINSANYIMAIVVLVSLVNSSIIYREQIYQFRRSPIKSDSFKVSNSEYLKNVKIDSSSANVVNNFIETLRSINFNYKTDRIFAYPELPGLLASSDALSLGDAHNQHSFSRKQFRELKSIETKICAFLKYENISEVDNVYILVGESISDTIMGCLGTIVDINSKTKIYDLGMIFNIGMAYNDYIDYETKIRLIGPFKLKSN